jgi:hypothetical protein
MKKFILVIATAIVLSSCGVSMPKPEPKLVSTSTHTKINAATPVVAVFADLEVSPDKITFFYLPSKTVVKGGIDNVIDSAVREALASNGNADVLVGLETQIKYNDLGEAESITVTGYPAKYVNFRNPGDDYLRTIGSAAPAEKQEANGGGFLKIGK